MKNKIKCQCNTESILRTDMRHLYHPTKELPFVNHKPNECKCTNDLKQYIREDKKIWLCSCCCLAFDKEVKR